MRLSDEALRYFEQAGDDGDKVYAAALRKRIRELEDGLRHIRDHRYSSEMCREIASAALDGRDDYKEPR